MKARRTDNGHSLNARRAHDLLKVATRLLAEGGYKAEASCARTATRRVESALHRGKRRMIDTYAVEAN